MYVMNIGRTGDKSVIPKLNEQAAIDLGANLLGLNHLNVLYAILFLK